MACLSANDAFAKALTASYSPLQILFLRNVIALPATIVIALPATIVIALILAVFRRMFAVILCIVDLPALK
ncbi:hypothetical protein [Thioclava sp. JE_KL1]|uniref:hypothetical protein n=1 Tax=Thioclava sp. JE_KL1 TaxID=2651187 RepID=UPI0020A3F75B|nr:hypothetical protein [Thioclava sp. JE_KL1]